MDIKTVQLKNNTQVTDTTSAAVRVPAKIEDGGNSFADEMANLGKTDKIADKNEVADLKQNNVSNVNEKQTSEKDVKNFEYVSTTENSFKNALNKENMTVSDRQAVHKEAEKELVDEIVLMNNKQNETNKKSVKNDLNLAQAANVADIEGKENRTTEARAKTQTNETLAENETNGIKKEISAEKQSKTAKNSVKDIVLTDNENFQEKNTVTNISKNTKAAKEQNTVTDYTKNTKNVKAAENVQEVETADNTVKAKIAGEKTGSEELKSMEKAGKSNFSENVISLDKADKKANKKSVKVRTEKNSEAKGAEKVENVGKIKDTADVNGAKQVDLNNIQNPDNMKVIKMEVVSPLAELNNSLNSTKSSDIVKFIDANLSTDTTKTAKTKVSKTSAADKKSSSEKVIKMTEADANFFNNLIETNQQVIDGTKTADQSNNLLRDIETVQSAKVSKSLLNALKESRENNTSFRVDFDRDISVVLKVSKSGHISADFIPGDEAVEQYLKANIPLLKQKFNDEGLEYDNLSYRQNKKDQNEEKGRQNRGNQKENGYE